MKTAEAQEVVPVLLSATPGDGQVTLTWEHYGDQYYYDIYKSTDNINFSLTGDGFSPATSTTIIDLTNGTTYYFKFYAINATSWVSSPESNMLSATPIAAPVNQTPIVDAGINQTITLPSGVTLSGNANDDGLPNPPGAMTYQWSMQSGPGVVNFNDATVLNPTATFSVDGTYVLQLTASDGELSSSGTVTITVNPEPQPPVAPVLTGAVSGDTLVDLTWNAVTGATGYKVKYGTASGVYGAPIDALNVTTKTINGLTNGTAYYFAVTAYNVDGESLDSNELSATPVAPAVIPTVTLAANPLTITEGDSTTLTWSSTDADTCTASNGWTGVKAASGAEVLSPTADTTYTLTCTGSGGNASDTVNIIVNPANTLAIIPGTIQAEDYNLGGEGIAYHDTTAGNSGGKYRSEDVDIENTTDIGGGVNVGWIATNEWLKYDVDVQTDGLYNLDFRVARNPSGSGQLHLEVDGTDVTGSITIPSTGGWQTWTTVTFTGVSLTSGQHTLKIFIESGSFNINWISFTRKRQSNPSGCCDYFLIACC